VEVSKVKEVFQKILRIADPAWEKENEEMK